MVALAVAVPLALLPSDLQLTGRTDPHTLWIPEPRVFSDGEAAVTPDAFMGSTKGWTIPLMVGQPGRDRPWAKSCVWFGSTV